MKRIVQTIHYNTEELDSQGFKTDQQKRGLICAAELIDEIRKADGPFGMLVLFISEADLFMSHPVTIWSNMTDQDKLMMFEDYTRNRLAMKAEAKEELAP